MLSDIQLINRLTLDRLSHSGDNEPTGGVGRHPRQSVQEGIRRTIRRELPDTCHAVRGTVSIVHGVWQSAAKDKNKCVTGTQSAISIALL